MALTDENATILALRAGLNDRVSRDPLVIAAMRNAYNAGVHAQRKETENYRDTLDDGLKMICDAADALEKHGIVYHVETGEFIRPEEAKRQAHIVTVTGWMDATGAKRITAEAATKQ